MLARCFLAGHHKVVAHAVPLPKAQQRMLPGWLFVPASGTASLSTVRPEHNNQLFTGRNIPAALLKHYPETIAFRMLIYFRNDNKCLCSLRSCLVFP